MLLIILVGTAGIPQQVSALTFQQRQHHYNHVLLQIHQLLQQLNLTRVLQENHSPPIRIQVALFHQLTFFGLNY